MCWKLDFTRLNVFLLAGQVSVNVKHKSWLNQKTRIRQYGHYLYNLTVQIASLRNDGHVSEVFK